MHCSTTPAPPAEPGRSREWFVHWRPGRHRQARPSPPCICHLHPAAARSRCPGCPAAIAEVQALFEHAPILGARHKTKTRATRNESGVTDDASHRSVSPWSVVYFLSIIRSRKVPDLSGHANRKPLQNRYFSTSANVRRRLNHQLSRRKQGFESPRERQLFQRLQPALTAISERDFRDEAQVTVTRRCAAVLSPCACQRFASMNSSCGSSSGKCRA